MKTQVLTEERRGSAPPATESPVAMPSWPRQDSTSGRKFKLSPATIAVGLVGTITAVLAVFATPTVAPAVPAAVIAPAVDAAASGAAIEFVPAVPAAQSAAPAAPAIELVPAPAANAAPVVPANAPIHAPAASAAQAGLPINQSQILGQGAPDFSDIPAALQLQNYPAANAAYQEFLQTGDQTKYMAAIEKEFGPLSKDTGGGSNPPGSPPGNGGSGGGGGGSGNPSCFNAECGVLEPVVWYDCGVNNQERCADDVWVDVNGEATLVNIRCDKRSGKCYYSSFAQTNMVVCP